MCQPAHRLREGSSRRFLKDGRVEGSPGSARLRALPQVLGRCPVSPRSRLDPIIWPARRGPPTPCLKPRQAFRSAWHRVQNPGHSRGASGPLLLQSPRPAARPLCACPRPRHRLLLPGTGSSPICSKWVTTHMFPRSEAAPTTQPNAHLIKHTEEQAKQNRYFSPGRCGSVD